MIAHLLQSEFNGLAGMRELYSLLRCYPTSTRGDMVLIRSHIAYHSGQDMAQRAVISASRGHSYKVEGTYVGKVTVRIVDYYDHRFGVVGWTLTGPPHKSYRVLFDSAYDEPVKFSAVSDAAAIAFVDGLYNGEPTIIEVITTTRTVRA